MLAEVVISGKMTPAELGSMLAARVCDEPEPNPKRKRKRGIQRKVKDVLDWYRLNRGAYSREDLRYAVGLDSAEADAVYRFLVKAEREAKESYLDADADAYGVHYWVVTDPEPDLTGLKDVLRGASEKNPKGPVRRGRASKATWIHPPPEASIIAASALERRLLLPPSRRGGLTRSQAGRQGITSGVERAESIARGDEQPAQDIDAFFQRFRGTYEDSLIKHPWERSKVQQAWDLWGGRPMWDAARRALGKPIENPGCLPCLMLANPSPLPKLEPLDLAGRRVALAINLHRCRPGKPIPEGAACFSVREKPRSSSKVLGYAERLVLKDVEFVVNERSLERIERRGTREVCCFVVGTVLRPRAAELKGACACDWTPIHFNPFRAPCFTTPRGKCAVSARYAAMVGKSVAAEGVRTA
jgi:hypothetical protein